MQPKESQSPPQPDVRPIQPPARPASQLNVPSRPAAPIHDFDDSAFNVGEETPPPAAVTQVARMPQPAPTAPVTQPDATPPAPMAPLPPVQAQPVTPAQPTPAPTSSTPAPPPLPPAPPIPAQVPPPPVLPPSNPPAIPTTTPQPVVPPVIPPMAVTALEHPQKPPGTPTSPAAQSPAQPTPEALPTPQPASAAVPAAAQSSPVTYEPPTGPHIATELVERIDETPQQNSRDIEELIERNHRLKRLKGFASFLVFVAGVVVAAFLINQYIFQSYYVDGTSMTPTLQNDDRLIIDKVERTFANVQGKPYIPERGQIVVLDSSIIGANGRDEQLIKRVIGLPGDRITIQDGVVMVYNEQNPDGFNVNEKLGLELAPTYVESPQEWNIEPGKVFVMGDNRTENGSFDSRAFGPIEHNKIVGRLWARILPVDKAKLY